MPEPRTIPVEAARAAVLASGQLAAIDGPQFLADPEAEWLRYHVKPEPPLLARVIITRTGQQPREIVVSWAEYEKQEQNTPDWNATRAEKPMTIFGSEVERHAYRVVFADILAPLLDDRPAATADPAPWEAPAAPAQRDWATEIEAAQTVLEIDTIDREARAVRAFRADAEGTALHRQLKAKRKALAEAPAADDWAPAPGPSVDAQGPATPERAATVQAGIRRPQDHLPGNRASRRASKRKGGRR
ncbi:hypothetical protein [Microbacterium oleivorans]|uniref:Uncharacterized protein n=1 Tax=Microbacterium oleivorans TaxID=273677 RepID=A0A7D5JCH3_9MICO|nr:hypothetical protein [Microbacterium oleivorans]QLD10920.1 hypothetical protein HW566_03435 [Microbacterium oleivorans]